MLGAIAAVGGIASGVSSIMGGISANNDAKKAAEQQRILGEKQAQLIAAETGEQIRRNQQDQYYTMGQAEATVGASGFAREGTSVTRYLDAMAKNYERENDWSRRVSEQRQEVARMTGQYQADTLESQGRAAMYQGFTSAIKPLTGSINFFAGL